MLRIELFFATILTVGMAASASAVASADSGAASRAFEALFPLLPAAGSAVHA